MKYAKLGFLGLFFLAHIQPASAMEQEVKVDYSIYDSTDLLSKVETGQLSINEAAEAISQGTLEPAQVAQALAAGLEKNVLDYSAVYEDFIELSNEWKGTLDSANAEGVDTSSMTTDFGQYNDLVSDYSSFITSDTSGASEINNTALESSLTSVLEAVSTVEAENSTLLDTINKLQTDVSKSGGEVINSEQAPEEKEAEQAVEAEEDDEFSDPEEEASGEDDSILASLVDGIMDALLIIFSNVWNPNYQMMSFADFGYALFSLLFDGITLDWSPLKFTLNESQVLIVTSDTSSLSTSEAFSLFNKLQDYKSYFETLMLSYFNDGMNSSEKNWLIRLGNPIVNIEYKIENNDLSVLNDIAALLSVSVQDSWIKVVVSALQKNSNFSWLTLDNPLALSVSSEGSTVSQADLVAAMKNMQRLESVFLAKLVSIQDSGVQPDKTEQDSTGALANLINSFSVKIKNQDPQVFIDLSTINEQVEKNLSTFIADPTSQANELDPLIQKYSLSSFQINQA